MKNAALLYVLPLLAALVVAPAAPARGDTPSKDIVSTAVEAGSFQTLAAALEAADLVDALRGAGPFTVFAPTDEAFAKLPDGTVAGLLDPDRKAELAAILTYHVVPGRILSSDLLGATSARTLEGRDVAIGLRVGGANVVQADILCANGVIHVIDAVMLPPARRAERSSLPASAADMIRSAIAKGAPLYNDGHEAACAAVYEVAAEGLLRLPDADLGALHRQVLREALETDAKDGSERAWNLRRAFDRVLEDLSFEPLREAALPAGFPAPGPVGRIVSKTYPRYRAARSEGGNSFWTLFRHIKKNDIAMTAPVEMTMSEDMRTLDMAFLYEAPSQGDAGKDGAVAVLDLPPTTVLSIGMRGASSTENIRRAKALIEARLASAPLARAGAWRLLGYNSPMVPNAKRYWELQLPVEPARP